VGQSSGKSGSGWAIWLPSLAWAVLLFLLSSIPGSRIPPLRISYADKIAHTLLYGGFGLLCFRALRRSTKLGAAAAVVLAAAIALLYGTTDEIHQMFVPMRSPELLDVAADLAGGSLGAACGWLGGHLIASRRAS
jgi:VanZ family protein